ncbi:hypothetical protein D3C71_1856120 [compost metagenome]
MGLGLGQRQSGGEGDEQHLNSKGVRQRGVPNHDGAARPICVLLENHVPATDERRVQLSFRLHPGRPRTGIGMTEGRRPGLSIPARSGRRGPCGSVASFNFNWACACSASAPP